MSNTRGDLEIREHMLSFPYLVINCDFYLFVLTYFIAEYHYLCINKTKSNTPPPQMQLRVE